MPESSTTSRRPVQGPTARPSLRRRRSGGRPVFTGRALVLGALVVLLVIVLASPVKRYLQSRSALSSSAVQLQNDRAEQAQLQHQQQQYGQHSYVEQQARQRLQYAMPGDTVYQVVGSGDQSSIQTTTTKPQTTQQHQSWNTRLMDSVRAAAR